MFGRLREWSLITVETEKVRSFVFGGEKQEPAPVFYMPVFNAEEGRQVWEKVRTDCVLVCMESGGWNRELSPWRAERVFEDGEDFGSGADGYLKLITERVIPAAEQSLGFAVRERGLVGYSLAGLFAVYAMYRTRLFDYIGSVSGSLWFDGFEEYAAGERQVCGNPRLYLSLGSREHRTGNPRLRRVRECTERLARLWAKTLPVTLEINPGGHFDDPGLRMARAIEQLVTRGRSRQDNLEE